MAREIRLEKEPSMLLLRLMWADKRGLVWKIRLTIRRWKRDAY